MAREPDVIEWDGANVTASQILDADHEVAGDDDADNCEVCGAAVGWRADTGLKKVHSTLGGSLEAADWVTRFGRRPS